MIPTLTPTRRRNELIAYFILAYAISWAFEIPVALSAQGIIQQQIPPAVYYLASFGPFLAGLFVSAVSEGSPGLRRFFSGLLIWRVERSYALFTFLAPPVLFIAALAFAWVLPGADPNLRLLGQADYLPYLGPLAVFVLWLLTYGFGEEMGWRGFALPRLQAERSAFSASMILGVIWAGWHLPAFFFRDTYLSMGPFGFAIFLISVLAATVTLTWLYNGTRGSVLMVIVFHALFNYFSVSEAGGDWAPILMSAAIVFWAVRAVNVYGRENLAPVEKISV